jgi:hypothetical protein
MRASFWTMRPLQRETISKCGYNIFFSECIVLYARTLFPSKECIAFFIQSMVFAVNVLHIEILFRL